MAYSKKDRERYNARREALGKELGLTKNHYNALRRVGEQLHRSAEDSAMGSKNWRYTKHNWGHDEPYTEKDEKRDKAHAFSKAEAIRKKLGGKKKIHFYHQTDPRGASLYVGKDRMSARDYNSKGHAIY